MGRKVRALLVGRSTAALERLAAQLRGMANIELATRCQTNGHTDPLYQVSPLPDVAVLVLSASWEQELAALEARPPEQRPELLVVGSEGDARVMRKAMHAGARDLLIEPLAEGELATAIGKIATQSSAHRTGEPANRLIAVTSVKGGAGGSVVASSLGHILAVRLHSGVCIADLDLQFGTVPLYLNVEPERGLLEALDGVESMDTDALKGFMAKHSSGLHILAPKPGELALPGEVPATKLTRMLDLARRQYEHTIVDLPRLVDASWTSVVGKSDRVLLVLQQSVAHVRNARHFNAILRQEMGLSAQQIVVVVNRYAPKSRVTVKDITEALDCEVPVLIPNDYPLITESADLGSPLYELKKGAAATKALFDLAARLSIRPLTGPSLLRRAVSSLVGHSPAPH